MPPNSLSVSADNYNISEGGSTGVHGSFYDPGNPDSYTVNINWGDNSPNTILNLQTDPNDWSGYHTFSAEPHQYGNAGYYTINLVVTDQAGEWGWTSTSLQVANIAPDVSIAGLPSGGVEEGTDVNLTASATDPGDDITSYGWTVTGPDGFALPEDAVTNQSTFSFTPTISGNYSVGLAVTDAGNLSGTDIETVSITPNAPTNPAATAGNTHAALSWDWVWDANSYNVYRNGTFVQNVSDGSCYYEDSGVCNGNSYNYTVTAVGAGGESAASASVSATPHALAAPTNLTAAIASGTRISLSWTDNADNEAGYVIERKAGTGNFEQIDWVEPDTTSYDDWTVAEGASYSYRVQASGVGGDGYGSGYSNTTTALDPANALSTTISGATTTDEGANYTLTFSSTSSYADRVDHWVVDWGDGWVDQVTPAASGATTASHVYLNVDSYTPSAKAFDAEGGSFDAALLDSVGNPMSEIQVTAVASTISAKGASLATVGSVYSLLLSAAGIGSNNVSNWNIDWGDGTSSGPESAGSDGVTWLATHPYSQPGSYTIHVTATDDSGALSADAITVEIAAQPTSVPPRVWNTWFSLSAGASQSFAAHYWDGTNSVGLADHGTANLTYRVATGGNPAHGTVSLSTDGSFTYTPTAGFAGIDRFLYVGNDGTQDSNVGCVTVNVCQPHMPVAANTLIWLDLDEGTITQKSGSVASACAWADANSFTAITAPSHNASSFAFASDGSFTWTPASSMADGGDDSFTYRAKVDGVWTAPATAFLRVMNHHTVWVIDHPQYMPEPYDYLPGYVGTTNFSVSHDGVLSGDLTLNNSGAPSHGVGLWGESLAAQLDGSVTPAHGALTNFNTSGTFTYVPNAGFAGWDCFTFTITDSNGTSQPITAAVRVTDTLPTGGYTGPAVGGTWTTTMDTPLNVSASDGLLRGRSLTVPALEGWMQPKHGTVSIDPTTGSFTYTPNTGFYGADRFSYRLSDGVTAGLGTGQASLSGSDIATVEVVVNPAAVIGSQCPVDLKAQLGTYNSIGLAWGDTTGGTTSFELQYSTTGVFPDPASDPNLKEPSAGTTSWLLTGLDEGQAYSFRVRAQTGPTSYSAWTDVVAIGTNPLGLGLTGHRTGARFGDPVPQGQAQDPQNYVMLVNDDSDDALGVADNSLGFGDRPAPSGGTDDDLARITIGGLPQWLKTGVVRITLSDSAAVHVLDSAGHRLSGDQLEVDLANATGYLAGLTQGDLDIWLEGVSPNSDFQFSVEYLDLSGAVVKTNDIHLTIAQLRLTDPSGSNRDYVTGVLSDALIDAAGGGSLFADVAASPMTSGNAATFFQTRVDGLAANSPSSLTLASSSGDSWDFALGSDGTPDHSAVLYDSPDGYPLCGDDQQQILTSTGAVAIGNGALTATLSTAHDQFSRQITTERLQISGLAFVDPRARNVPNFTDLGPTPGYSEDTSEEFEQQVAQRPLTMSAAALPTHPDDKWNAMMVYFKAIYGKDGEQLWEAYHNAQTANGSPNIVEWHHYWRWLHDTKSEINWVGARNSVIELADDLTDPVEIAGLLYQRLLDATADPNNGMGDYIWAHFATQGFGMPDLNLWISMRRRAFERGADLAAKISQLYVDGCVLGLGEGGNLVLTIRDLSQGNYLAAINLLPFVSKALATKTGSLIIKTEEGTTELGEAVLRKVAEAANDEERLLIIEEAVNAGKGKLVGSLKGLEASERAFVEESLSAGRDVEIIPRQPGIKTPDFKIDGVITEYKKLEKAGTNTLKNALEAAAEQSSEHILIDARGVAIDAEDAIAQIERAEGNVGGLKGRVTVLTSAGEVKY